MNYGEVYTRLTYEFAFVKFRKRGGDIRYMLATRNLNGAALEHGNLGGLLAGHDKRCNIKNGNMAVIDIIIGECRSFNIQRVLDIQWLGQVETQDEYDTALSKFIEIKNKSEEADSKVDLDLL